MSNGKKYLLSIDYLSRCLVMLFCTFIQGYQYFVSPLFQGCCRFFPSCSVYAIEALHMHGVLKGGWFVIYRLLRCHPYCQGGCDPVPRSKKGCN